MELATPTSKADTSGKPADATHVLMFWPPSGPILHVGLARFTRKGEWALYTVPEFEEGDYCCGNDRKRNAAKQPSRKDLGDLAAWSASQAGYPVTLQYAGETEYGPVYWVIPDGSR